MPYAEHERFNNRRLMIQELKDTGVIIADFIAESDLVFQYNLHFLANTYEHQVESRRLGINRTRNANGNFKW